MLQMPRLVSLILMATVIVVLGLTFYQVVAPFLMPLFLAGVLAVLCQPIFARCLGWTGQRTAAAAGLTTLIILGMILIPMTLGTVSAARQLYRIAQPALHDPDWREAVRDIRNNATVQNLVHRYNELTGEQVQFDDIQQEVDAKLSEVSETLARKTLGFAGSTISLLGWTVAVLIGGMTFVIALYYFLADGPALIEASINLIPVHRDYQRQLITQFDQAVRAVISATFAAAIGQGLAAGIGMYVAGFHHFFLVTILATLTALVPLLGTWLVWAPYALWLGFHEGHWIAAGCLALYGTVFIGLLDNAIRTYVLNSNVKLHPLLAFVSVLGGLQALGLWGVFIGPIVASCLHALVKIFNTELVAFSHERQVPGSGHGSGKPGVDPEASTMVMAGSDLDRLAVSKTPRPGATTIPVSRSGPTAVVPASAAAPSTSPPAGEAARLNVGKPPAPLPATKD